MSVVMSPFWLNEAVLAPEADPHDAVEVRDLRPLLNLDLLTCQTYKECTFDWSGPLVNALCKVTNPGKSLQKSAPGL